ncbi:MAG TPA: chromosome segregation protein SMC, partial [Pyrinomonadaceae bacterium]|nr:chromosome segregation protein SMC [Pyrinomonadaceae bacterium]
LEPRPVAAFVKRQATPYLLRVRTRSGREVTATPYHPLFTLDGGRLRALKAEELKVGVRLALPRRLPATGEETKLPAFDVLKRFTGDDRVYVPSSTALQRWVKEARVEFGTYEEWGRVAGVPQTQFRGLRDGQSIGTATLAKLSNVAQLQPPLDGRFKSHGSAAALRFPERFTPDLARFCGLLIAEGRSTNANQIRFVNSDRAVNDEFERLASTLFDVKVSRQQYKPLAEDNLIYSRALGVALERLFNFSIGSCSADKEVPPQVFRAEAETQWAFLSGLFEGDAHICARPAANGKPAHAYVEYVSASRKLAEQVVALLLRRGVFAVLREKEKYASNTAAKRRRTYYSVYIYGTEQLRRVAGQLSFVGNKRRALEVLRRLASRSNPNHDLIPGATQLVKEAASTAKVNLKANRSQCSKLAAYVEQRCEASRGGLLEVVNQIERLGMQPEQARPLLSRLSILATSDVYWDEIVSIDQVPPPDDWVYDLSIAGTHNFVAGNIVVHNSNVADAISWVLGEQRAKQLRGAEMKDVIFQGARNRAASGMAEVVLHLVRDETIEEEPDIDDIDSALEEIDEQTEAFEGKLSPELLGEAVPIEAPGAGNPSGAQLADRASGNEAALSRSGGDGELSVVSSHEAAVNSAESTQQGETESSVSTTAEGEGEAAGAATAKARHKRHWRPRRMALEFGPGESVSVTRRLYGSGESEYLLNNRPCRLRDIQDLFSGTGLAGAHYAIIEQGRIGQILSAKPMDRRTLIEEAAGITKFRVRQRAAEARLEGARTNLHRISDIISEIERQANSLRRQAGKARRYAQLREELRDLLRRVYVADERALVALLSELQSRLLEASEEERSLAATLEAGEDEARRTTAEAREIEEQLSGARAEVAESTLQSDRRARERVYQQEQATTLEGRIAGVAHEIEGVRARLAQVGAECDGLRAIEVQVRDASEEAARALETAETAHAGRMTEVLDAEAKIEVARAELLTHTAVAERLMEIGRQLESALERLAAQAEGLEREGERAATAYEAAKIAAENLQIEITESRARLDAHVAEREDAAREVAAARAVVSETVAAHERVRDEAARVRHRLDTLAELDAQHALYSQAVQRIFSHDEADKATKDFHSIATLADVLRVEPHWERAVESVFGSYLQSVIVPTPDDAMRAATWLQVNDAGRATFFVAGLHGGGEGSANSFGLGANAALVEDGADNDSDSLGTRVGDLLGAPREVAAVLERTLPREVNARIVKDLDLAMMRSLATGEMFVTARGEWVAGGQLLAAGGPLSAGDGAGLLAFKREMRDLEASYTGLEADLLFAEQSASRARERLGQLEDAYVLLNEVIGREEREHVARELTGTQLAQDIERAGRHMRVVADDAARLAEERRLLEERGLAQKKEAEAAEDARLAATREVMQAAELLSAARRAAEAESERLGKQRAAAAAAGERRRATTSELKRMEAEEGDLHARLERHTHDLNEMESRLTDLRRSIAQMDEGAERVDDERAACERKVEQVAGRLAEARERADACSSRLTDLRHQAAAVRDARGALDVQRAEASTRLNYVREACAHDLSQTPEELALDFELEKDFDLEPARAHVEELRARLEGFGAVNMMALEELAEAEERLQFLIAQRQDITDGIISTDEALREIKRRSRERFRHAFEAINRNFGQFFVELFGGGRGEMNLLDADDVLESGIDITAQPPGKRLQNVLLLSGGEKAMAALALVLAIFRYRPSPFCLLDEVDAPLDEANIGRFTNKITEMSANTQFIVITHNKRTMEVARALYGVTMEDAGISKLVSVRLE